MTEPETLEIIAFKRVVQDVRLLMELYYDYFLKNNVLPEKVVEIPKTYTVVRAIEASFFDLHNLKSVVGHCAFANFDKNVLLHIALYSHIWLTWNDKYIVDVIPFDGKFGISVPQAVFPMEKFSRFSAFDGIYPKDFTESDRRKVDIQVEEMSQLFDELFKNVSC